MHSEGDSRDNKTDMVNYKVRLELRHWLNTSPTGACVFYLNDDYNMLEANDVFFEALSYTRASAQEAGITSLLQPLEMKALPTITAIANRLRNHPDEVIEKKCRLRGGDGKWRYFLARLKGCNTLLLPHGKFATINIMDVSEYMDTLNKLHMNEEKLRLIFNQDTVNFYILDVNTRSAILPNQLASDILGICQDQHDLPESTIRAGLIEPHSEQNFRQFFESIYNGEPSGSTIFARKVKNECYWYKATFVTIFDMSKRPSSALITYDDITDVYRKQLTFFNLRAEYEKEHAKTYSFILLNIKTDQIEETSEQEFERSFIGCPLVDFVKAYVKKDVYPLDETKFREMMNTCDILDQHKKGKNEINFATRKLDYDETQEWNKFTIRTLEDPYSGDIKAFISRTTLEDEAARQFKLNNDIERLKKELEKSHVKVLINQMQPHFLYNALSAIRTIVRRDPMRAYDLLYDFTVYLRGNTKALTSDSPIPFTEELHNIQAYLNIEQMRFSDLLQVKYDIQCYDFNVVPLTVQPLVENAAKHGVFQKTDGPGIITIRALEDENNYLIEVEDNGVGFDVDEAFSRGSSSFGLKNLIFRLNALLNASVSIASSPDKGTLATVIIPKERDELFANDIS